MKHTIPSPLETDQIRFRWHKDARIIAARSYCWDSACKRVADYGETLRHWPRTKTIAITLADSAEALLAHFAALQYGFRSCIVNRDLAQRLDPDQFSILSKEAPTEAAPALESLEPSYARTLCFSSGTTGKPKAISRSHASWIFSFTRLAELGGVTNRDRVAVLGHQMHSLSHYGAMEALYQGATLYLFDGLSAASQLARISEQKVSLIYVTPAQLRLLALAAKAEPNLRVRRVMVGGANLDAATRSKTLALFPMAEVIEFYGASETSFIALSDAQTPEGSVGRPFPGVSLEIRDPGGTPLPPDQVGVIWLHSPMLFDEYVLGQSAETRMQNGYLTIGELGWLDQAGYLYVKGRRTRMVTIADQNVFLDDIETHLNGIKGVTTAAAVALPDPLRGHRICAVVCGKNLHIDRLRRSCKAALGPLACPKQIVLLSRWPVLPSGKTDYTAIAALFDGAEK